MCKNMEFLTVDEISALMKLPKSWFYGKVHIKDSGIPFLKCGKYLRFNPEEVVEWLKEKQAVASG